METYSYLTNPDQSMENQTVDYFESFNNSLNKLHAKTFDGQDEWLNFLNEPVTLGLIALFGFLIILLFHLCCATAISVSKKEKDDNSMGSYGFYFENDVGFTSGNPNYDARLVNDDVNYASGKPNYIKGNDVGPFDDNPGFASGNPGYVNPFNDDVDPSNDNVSPVIDDVGPFSDVSSSLPFPDKQTTIKDYPAKQASSKLGTPNTPKSSIGDLSTSTLGF